MFKKSAAPSAAGGYTIAKSLRFRSSASAYLNRTPASASNRQKWTWSGWVKRGKLGALQMVFWAGSSSTDTGIYFNSDDTLYINGNNTTLRVTSQVFRDPSAWYHIVVALDTTQATAGNRVLLYVNGAQVTSFSTNNAPTLNDSYAINNNTAHYIGEYVSGGNYYFDGYMAEVNFIDGQQLTPTSFGSTNSTTGVWQPIAYTGTYGTNGFYLKFTDTSSTAALGTDYSGNSNTWTVNNISLTAGSTYDSMTDVPTLTSATTANYCVWNPLNGSSYALANGNLQTAGAGATSKAWAATLSVNSGKWYYEYQYVSSPATNGGGGIWDINSTYTANSIPDSGTGTRYVPQGGGAGNIFKFINGTSTLIGTYASYTTGDIIGVAFDCGAGTVSYYKNNTLQVTITDSNFVGKSLTPVIYTYTGDVAANFGQQPFAYTPPSGFVALNTYNLPTSTIVAGNKVMDATLYTGNGSTLSVTNAAGFKPDLVWGKCRSNTYNHALVDSNRGVSRWLGSNSTSAEIYTAGDFLTSFNSNGFSVGSAGVYNANAETYVGWQWQAGQGTTSSNTDGSITSTVSVNATAGFSVVTYTSPSSGVYTVGHGLGVAPSLIINKARGTTGNWLTWHIGLTGGASNTNTYVALNLTDAQATSGSQIWSAPTSTTFGCNAGLSVAASTTYVAYCWSEIAGFSKFGSYTGNGSADGPFVYLGFRPKFIMYKRTDSSSEWVIEDGSRSPYNLVDTALQPNSANSEATIGPGYGIDFLSNGYKIRTAGGATNASGGTYIYACFAENPFKNALAR